jgi:hypothetical protein
MLVAAPSASTEQLRLDGIAMTMPKPLRYALAAG